MPQPRLLMKGTEAMAEAAIRAGCRYFFGYPITPQNEIPEYMAKRLPQVGGVYVQAESELAAINMVYGAGGAGARVLTSSSSPGVALMSEGFSYLVGSEIPAVIVNMMRAGPGLGGISPAQGDYMQMTRSLGHGDKHAIVLAPSTVQEAADLMSLAFDKADQYRNPVLIMGDGLIGQMMEPVSFDENPPKHIDKSWATVGKPKERRGNILRSLYLDPESLEQHVVSIFEKFKRMEAVEQRHEEFMLDDRPPVVLCAYGTVARIAKSAVRELRAQGIQAGLFRPITAWPFPRPALSKTVDFGKLYYCFEMSMGQMVEDVQSVVQGRRPVRFWGRVGGVVPTVEEIVARVREELDGNGRAEQKSGVVHA